MDRGFIKVYRKIIDSLVFYNPLKLQLFMYLLLSANHKKGVVYGKEIERGQLLTGRKRLSSELNCKESTVYKNLKWLEKEKLILLKSNNKNTIVTICNYETYQDRVTANVQQGNNSVTTKEQQSNTNKNDKNKKNVKNDKKQIEREKQFDDFWNFYNKKKGSKENAKRKFLKLSDNEILEIKETLPRFLKSIKDKQYLPYPETYLNKKRWLDEISDEDILSNMDKTEKAKYLIEKNNRELEEYFNAKN